MLTIATPFVSVGYGVCCVGDGVKLGADWQTFQPDAWRDIRVGPLASQLFHCLCRQAVAIKSCPRFRAHVWNLVGGGNQYKLFCFLSRGNCTLLLY